ncbi:MAG: hypothetical protein JHC37_00955 [Campylobacteraceae bacterium]|jgi:hypothetical protein|nr:hypothetical protein [Campylobacteraceae bacterium]
MKTKYIALFTALMLSFSFGGCAYNFPNWDAWKEDKAGERYAAEVLTSEVKDGVIYGTARVYSTGKVVDYVQKPYIKTTLPFSKGTTIFVDKK